jgi:DNA-binding beta-propeller fold protein YncE
MAFVLKAVRWTTFGAPIAPVTLTALTRNPTFTASGVPVRPELALGSWAAMKAAIGVVIATRVVALVVSTLLASSALGAQARGGTCAATSTSMTPAGWASPEARAKTPSAGSTPLALVADVPLPGPAKRFDYQSFDSTTGRLYISHMRGDRLVVFDARAGKVVASNEGFPGATGVWAVPELHRVYVSVTGRHEVAVVDDRTLAVVAHVGDVRFPDGIAYAPAEQKVFVSDESGEAEFVIDARSNTNAGRIALGGEAGNTHYDAVSHCIVVAVQTKNELAAIDPASERIVARYPMQCDHPHGFLIDEPNRLAFVTCEGDAKLLVVDLRTMRTTATLRTADDPDVLALDPILGRVYVGCEGGAVSVFEERFSGQQASLAPLGEYRAPHAHSVAVDPATHRVYLPLQDVNGKPTLRILEARP